MLPAVYQMPAAVMLLVAGGIACFFGRRLFRLVLALFGFIIGALAATSAVGSAAGSTMLLMVAVGGGLVGAGLLLAAYFIGVALLGAAMGAAVAHLAFAAGDGTPSVLMVVLFSIAGAVLSMYLERYVVIVGTAFGGAWTLIVGGLALAGNPLARRAAATGAVWVLYPLDPAPGRTWVPVVWVVLGLIGCAVQLGWTGGPAGRVSGRKRKK